MPLALIAWDASTDVTNPVPVIAYKVQVGTNSVTTFDTQAQVPLAVGINYITVTAIAIDNVKSVAAPFTITNQVVTPVIKLQSAANPAGPWKTEAIYMNSLPWVETQAFFRCVIELQ
jgi:hypothetical protein